MSQNKRKTTVWRGIPLGINLIYFAKSLIIPSGFFKIRYLNYWISASFRFTKRIGDNRWYAFLRASFFLRSVKSTFSFIRRWIVTLARFSFILSVSWILTKLIVFEPNLFHSLAYLIKSLSSSIITPLVTYYESFIYLLLLRNIDYVTYLVTKMNRTQQDLITGLILALEHEDKDMTSKYAVIAILRYVLMLEPDIKSKWMAGLQWKK